MRRSIGGHATGIASRSWVPPSAGRPPPTRPARGSTATVVGVPPLHMVPLVQSVTTFEARVLAARLGVEGIVWELRGGSSIYPVGWVDVLVAEADLDHARELLLLDELAAVLDDAAVEDQPVGAAAGPDRSSWWFGATLVVLTGGFLLMRILAL